MADIDDDGLGAGILLVGISGEEASDLFDGLLRGGEADADGRLVGEGFEALEGEREVDATFVVGDGVNFVDDYGFDGAQDGAALFGGEENVE